MKDNKFNLISYDEYFDDPDRISEKQEKGRYNNDTSVVTKDLVVLMQLNELYNKADNDFRIKTNEIEKLNNMLHYPYNENIERADKEYYRNIVTNILKNTIWKKEIAVKKTRKKVDILKKIHDQGKMIDIITFVDDNNTVKTCLQTEICFFDFGGDEDDDVCIYTVQNFVLNNIGGSATLSEDENDYNEVVSIMIDNIRELVIDGTKYIFREEID